MDLIKNHLGFDRHLLWKVLPVQYLRKKNWNKLNHVINRSLALLKSRISNKAASCIIQSSEHVIETWGRWWFFLYLVPRPILHVNNYRKKICGISGRQFITPYHSVGYRRTLYDSVCNIWRTKMTTQQKVCVCMNCEAIFDPCQRTVFVNEIE